MQRISIICNALAKVEFGQGPPDFGPFGHECKEDGRSGAGCQEEVHVWVSIRLSSNIAHALSQIVEEVTDTLDRMERERFKTHNKEHKDQKQLLNPNNITNGNTNPNATTATSKQETISAMSTLSLDTFDPTVRCCLAIVTSLLITHTLLSEGIHAHGPRTTIPARDV